MDSYRSRHLAFALLALGTVAAVLLAGIAMLAGQLTAPAAAIALVLFAALVGAMALVHDAFRTARWDAGYRVG